jgi:hypothetical protein
MIDSSMEMEENEITYTTSYIMGVPRRQEDIVDVEKVIQRLQNTNLFEYAGFRMEENPIVTVKYLGEMYEIELIVEPVEIPELFRVNHEFSEEDFNIMQQASMGITTAMEFGSNAMTSFHLQLKVIATMIPDLVGIIDFSSERINSGVWATLAAISQVPPSPNYIYSVQAVSSEAGTVWLHTHGLNRCNTVELEILDSNVEHYKTHYNLLHSVANRAATEGELPEEEEPYFVAYLNTGAPLIATWISWDRAIEFYDDDMLGGRKDREDGHNVDTGVIYVYQSKDEYERREFTHVSEIEDYIEDNMMMMISTPETNRMRALATERFDFFVRNYGKEGNHGLIKFGLLVDEEHQNDTNDEKEHIWFEILDIKGEKATAKLTQEPYFMNGLEVDQVMEIDISCMTDWILYTPECSVNPDSVYLLEMR